MEQSVTPAEGEAGEVSNSLEGKHNFAVTRACFLIEQYKNNVCVCVLAVVFFFSIIIQEPPLFSVIYRTFLPPFSKSTSLLVLQTAAVSQ